MRKWMRRVRGAVGMGLAWAAAWFGAGLLLLLVVGFGAADVPFPLGFGMLGFVAGITFSVLLRTAEGLRRFDEMSLPRFAGWGAAGGILLAVALVLVSDLGGDALPGLGVVFGLAGAASASGSLALARKAESRELAGGKGLRARNRPSRSRRTS